MKLIDISHILNNQTPIYPGDYQTSLEKYKEIDSDWTVPGAVDSEKKSLS